MGKHSQGDVHRTEILCPTNDFGKSKANRFCAERISGKIGRIMLGRSLDPKSILIIIDQRAYDLS
jgi:hypothetical protein